ncbi:PREDICTED: putative clathrin assembly protein At1g25240 [Ipomoea nil]|uniref:putative clathrin assembly protein At1g25240 n=1 Tax=Ipomoea nil TaxID=35883 RepID=UPI00090127CC|nr:PREDICTED: putative clathrin assembly protein At1g25240 [Ipomoea nil]
MGKLWNRAAGALKDQKSIVVARLGRRTALRRPDVEAVVIRATNHDESCVDCESVEKLYRMIRLSPNHFRPLIWAISRRMDKTGSWVVALKGLMLVHGVFSSRIPAVRKIGRLPFNFSDFKDRHSRSWITRGHNHFIRAYFAFLDHKSAILFIDHKEQTPRLSSSSSSSSSSLMQTLELLQKLQDVLDMTLKIRPNSADAVTVPGLIADAMDCMVVEIFDIHNRLCTGIVNILPRIFEASKAEAEAALKIAARVRLQSQELNDYYDLCNELGLTNVSKLPIPTITDKISKEQIQELEDITNGAGGVIPVVYGDSSPHHHKAAAKELEQPSLLLPPASTIAQQNVVAKETTTRNNSTIITHQWETFEEVINPAAYYAPPLLPLNNNLHLQHQHFPDLITF